jgi:hypothetical protein
MNADLLPDPTVKRERAMKVKGEGKREREGENWQAAAAVYAWL